jgi:hypothetical protein
MRKDWKYLTYLGAAVAFYLLVKLLSPREVNWTITYHHLDKNPFGTYALDELIDKLFDGNPVVRTNHTAYELYDSLQTPANLISLSTRFTPGREDVNALLNHVANGGTAYIAAQYFSGLFADTLGLNTSDYFFNDPETVFSKEDTSQLKFNHSSLASRGTYTYPRNNIHNYFAKYDSSATVIVVNDLNLPVTLKIKHGSGYIILNSTPLTLTNMYLLQQENTGFLEASLSYLPNRKTYWTEYYHLGKLEARTPLRFVLSTEPLRWAYYIAIVSLLLYMVFEARRRQRIIPVIKPLENTSLEFARTIGNLYYQAADHKNIAEKRIHFLAEQLRTRYGIAINNLSEETIQQIIRKTGNPETTIRELVDCVQKIQQQDRVSETDLKNLNTRIDQLKR